MRLTRGLLFDNEGSLKFKASLQNDIQTVIIPMSVDKVCISDYWFVFRVCYSSLNVFVGQICSHSSRWIH